LPFILQIYVYQYKGMVVYLLKNMYGRVQ
jgi:hypothetical protein